MVKPQQNRTPNRDKWFEKHARRGVGVPESNNRSRAVESSDVVPAPTPTTTTSVPPRPTPPSDRS